MQDFYPTQFTYVNVYHLRNHFNYIPSSDYARGTNDRKEDESFNLLYNLFSLPNKTKQNKTPTTLEQTGENSQR